MSQKTVNVSRRKGRYPIAISGFHINQITGGTDHITLAGSTEKLEITLTTESLGDYVPTTTPDFSTDVTGILEVEESEEIELREIPVDEASELVYKYIKEHPRATTNEIIFELRLDPRLAIKVLRNLEKEASIDGRQIE